MYPIHVNPSPFKVPGPSNLETPSPATEYHRKIGITPTPLIKIADGLFLKNETERFSLPSFKILGASWASHLAVCRKLGVPPGSEINGGDIILYTATDGNHGRAIGRMAKMMGLKAKIFIPKGLNREMEMVRLEGAEVIEVDGDYDEAVQKAWEASGAIVDSEMDETTENGIFVQDTAFEGYERIPKWVVEGYGTMLSELDIEADVIIVPVGVGSLASAISRSTAKIVTVEPDIAACLYHRLVSGKESIKTGSTIMTGMNCGTVATITWPVLKGVDVSLTVSDLEAHQAVQELKEKGISAGPCGAAPLAAYHRLAKELPEFVKGNVVLICTEQREYDAPVA